MEVNERVKKMLKKIAKNKQRTPEEIKRVLGLVEQVWLNTPDLRLMQLIINAAAKKGENSTIYYMEDDEFEANLQRAYEIG